MTLRWSAVAFLLLLSGCVTYPNISQSRSPCRLEPGGWCAFVREAAVDAYPYAIAATNTYVGDDDLFEDIGPNLVLVERLEIAEEDAEKGFDYRIFEQFAAGSKADPERQPIARILAFRGTDTGSLSDIFYGTLRDDQIDIALKYYRAERDRWGSGVQWVATGHSLGGALATEISAQYPSVRAYLFNTSPFYRSKAKQNDMYRTVFNERGEVLRRFAKFSASPAADVFTLNCAPQKGSFTKHKVRPLADCLTWIAAYEDADAKAVVDANSLKKPMVECGPDDKLHPGTRPPYIEPCVHQGRRDKPADGDSD
ncbi:hypothetical protein FGU71_10570 [Erythrobacter insulae]|uniref:Lipase family protein n=1 Tax=Erythrobacter insulae TaxID=2584124 RepID=A0A547PDP3_9SPHN|nr:hypothetical protein [Erythrobacter insulae]TRD12260.1 hypothetical protein FGU71_10570 [Erythrobacter insulae]